MSIAKWASFSNGMHPRRIDPVELVRRVMHRVEAPQWHEAVQRPVDPVAHEVHDQQHHHDLHDDRPAVRPQAAQRPVGGFEPVHQPEREREAQQVRHRHVERCHERGVGAHLARGRVPFTAVGQLRLMPSHQHSRYPACRVRRQREVQSHRGEHQQHRHCQRHCDRVRSRHHQPCPPAVVYGWYGGVDAGCVVHEFDSFCTGGTVSSSSRRTAGTSPQTSRWSRPDRSL